MCKAHATVVSTNKRIAKFEEEEDSESIVNLGDDLDAVFSRWVRLKYADENGWVKCYTCSKKLPISQIQNGHYIHRIDKATRWMPENCRPQCGICNSKHNDDPSIFRDKLEAETPGITTWLLEQSRDVCKPTREELRGLISEYRFKVKVLESKLKSFNHQNKTAMKRTHDGGENPTSPLPPTPPGPTNPAPSTT